MTDTITSQNIYLSSWDTLYIINSYIFILINVKVSRNRTEQAQGVPGKIRPRIFLTFGNTKVVGRQPYAPAAFTPEEIPGTHF
jgi:hypothetical protein